MPMYLAYINIQLRKRRTEKGQQKYQNICTKITSIVHRTLIPFSAYPSCQIIGAQSSVLTPGSKIYL